MQRTRLTHAPHLSPIKDAACEKMTLTTLWKRTSEPYQPGHVRVPILALKPAEMENLSVAARKAIRPRWHYP